MTSVARTVDPFQSLPYLHSSGFRHAVSTEALLFRTESQADSTIRQVHELVGCSHATSVSTRRKTHPHIELNIQCSRQCGHLAGPYLSRRTVRPADTNSRAAESRVPGNHTARLSKFLISDCKPLAWCWLVPGKGRDLACL